MAEFSEEETKSLVDAFSALGAKPKTDSPEDLRRWMEAFTDAHRDDKRQIGSENTQISNLRHFPRIVTFSGDSSKGDQSAFDLWRYEVRCLLEDKAHSEDVIRQAIRNSVRGEAGRIVMRLGSKASIQDILNKLQGVYGEVELSENLLSEFYSAQQKPGEDVAAWSCRLEDILGKAQERGQLDPSGVNEMLRTKFWTGLSQDLKDSSRHKFDTIKDFDQLRISIRSIEHEHKLSTHLAHTTPTVKFAQQNSALQKIENIVTDLSRKMKELQNDMTELKRSNAMERQEITAVKSSRPSYQYSNSRSNDQCSRCQRKGHTVEACHARRDVNGKKLN